MHISQISEPLLWFKQFYYLLSEPLRSSNFTSLCRPDFISSVIVYAIPFWCCWYHEIHPRTIYTPIVFEHYLNCAWPER